DGIETAGESFGFDAIVYATGFDAMTGALVGADVTGRDGLSLKEKWAAGPSTYLGLMTTGFPNFFMLTGPGSPSVLSNMTVSIEQHVDWVAECLKDMRAAGFETIEPTTLAESGWDRHVRGPAVPAVPPGRGARRPAPPGGVLPRRRLGARRPGLGRPARPGSLRALGGSGPVGELPARPRGSLPRRRTGRLRGRAVGG